MRAILVAMATNRRHRTGNGIGDQSAERLEKLLGVLEDARTMLIVMQNNPDPDAIAAAAGLREIANEFHGISCSLAHGGTIGRAENVALVRYLNLNPRAIEDLEVERFDRLAMVDAQPGAGNVSLPPDTPLDIVIDHHPIRRETRSARFTDVRRRYGATSTILYEYLNAAGLEIEPPLATALVYGIRSDTQDLGRESTRADVDAFLALYPKANARALGRIVAAPLPRAYFAQLRTVLDRAVVHGHSIVSSLGPLETPEMVAESADLLLRVEGVVWVMCYALVNGWLHASIRSSERGANAGLVARRVAGRRGFGGGHLALAAVQLPLRPNELADPHKIQVVENRMVRSFLRATGTDDVPGVLLCDQRSEGGRSRQS